MDVDLIFKIAGIGIIVAVLNLVLKRAEREEQAMMTTLAGLIVVLMMIIDSISGLFDTVKTVFGRRYCIRMRFVHMRFPNVQNNGKTFKGTDCAACYRRYGDDFLQCCRRTAGSFGEDGYANGIFRT